jgi:hypothetical protein
LGQEEGDTSPKARTKVTDKITATTGWNILSRNIGSACKCHFNTKIMTTAYKLVKSNQGKGLKIL